MAKEVSLQELREAAAAQREAWSKIPLADILTAIREDLQGKGAQELIQELRPLFDSLPSDDPIKQPLGSLIGLVTSLPALITQRLDKLSKE